MVNPSEPANRAERAPCPESLRVEPYLDGKLSEEAALAFESHVETCSRCARALDLRTNPQLQSAPIVPEFEIRGVIAHGGMGTIYRAYDLVMQREVALKVLKATPKDDSELRTRFLTEA